MQSKCKIIIAGTYLTSYYEKPLYNGFCHLGHEVREFKFFSYFHRPSKNESLKDWVKSLFARFQYKYALGPDVLRLNSDFIALCERFKPHFVFLYRNIYIYPQNIKKIKEMGIKIFSYNNDDPFGKTGGFLMRHFINGLSHSDHIFAYRKKNLDDYLRLGHSNSTMLRSYYIKERNFPSAPSPAYLSDVAFVGHFENDGRDELIYSLIEMGIKVVLYGGGWKKSPFYQKIVKAIGEVHLSVDNYNEIINSSKIALVFLSKINNDTYTRRCFEIPATKTFMLSEYTDELNSLFQEGVEAEYFRNKKELLDKVQYYLTNDEKRKMIAEKGHQKLLNSSHEALDRAKQILEVYQKL